MGRLYVICGHGAGDPGACGNGFSEAERVRALGAEIKRRGGDAVDLLDTSRNWYADGGVSSLSVPDGSWLVELHMDAGAPSARGGHVIIKAGVGGADAYDRALAERVSAIFPGRAQTIVERSDLANPNRAYRRGINYRLVENGFITSAGDVATFNSRLGELADAYLAAFGLASSGGAAQVPAPVTADIEEVGRGVYRLYNPGTGDHHFTVDHAEACAVAACGWSYEGVAWLNGDGGPVERLYDPNSGAHMLTADVEEHNALVSAGWVCEGEGMRQGSERPVHRLYNPNSGVHHFTTDDGERDALSAGGWRDEGDAFMAD